MKLGLIVIPVNFRHYTVNYKPGIDSAPAVL